MFVCIVQYFIFDYALINCRNPAGVARIIKNWGWPKWWSGVKDQQNIFSGFYRVTLCISAVFAVAQCVRLSVRPSVTLMHCVQTAEDNYRQTS